MIRNKAIFLADNHYHVYNHAIASENFFKHPDNYNYFIEKFHDYLRPYVHLEGYCLLPNHFHLLIRVKPFHIDPLEVNRITLKAFSDFHNCYTKSINVRYKRKGRLFQSPLLRIYLPNQVDVEKVAKYIYENPVEHGFCKAPDEWLHSRMKSELLAA